MLISLLLSVSFDFVFGVDFGPVIVFGMN